MTKGFHLTLVVILSASNIGTGAPHYEDGQDGQPNNDVGMPRIIGDQSIIYKLKKKAKKSCLAASLLGVDDDIHPCGEEDDVAGFTNELPPIFIPAPTITTSFSGPLSLMGALLMLVSIAMAAAYLTSTNNNLQRRSTATIYNAPGDGYGYYSSKIVPLLHRAKEKYYS